MLDELDEIASPVPGHVMGGTWYLIRSLRTPELSRGGIVRCINRDHYDGHDFIDEAKRSGAVAAMTSRPVELITHTSGCEHAVPLGNWLVIGGPI
ncbi:MAG: hypothetical protein CM1200mP41_23960 [Gammaproteobacteria bacterium]|nr:MAG: hypothetical protein CM1200mP41_23960 [Gammaproteobacteria bacterium]